MAGTSEATDNAAALDVADTYSKSNNARHTEPTAIAGGDLQVPDSLVGRAPDASILATPRAAAFALANGINLSRIHGTGRRNRISVSDIERDIVAAGGAVPARPLVPGRLAPVGSKADDRGVAATPVARRLAQRWGINLHDCRPSGSRNRVCKADVEARYHASRAIGEELTAEANVKYPSVTSTQVGEQRPLSGMRRTIARRLQASKRDAPHFRVNIDCRLDAMIAMRRQINENFSGAQVSINDFVVKAAANALQLVPDCNIQFDGDVIQYFADADIAVAVALEGGLMAPIVRRANHKTLVEISNEVRSLATRAKANTLSADDLDGGTFTVSNLGMYGVSHFDAIINPPQAAILAVGGAQQRVVVENDQPVVATVATLTLSADHRVIDGALAARFLQELRRTLEAPVLMMAG